MQDVDLLIALSQLGKLKDWQALRDHARDRAVDHVHRSVNDDGTHIEHSPDYHVLYARLVFEAIEAARATGSVPAELGAAYENLLAGLVHFTQPNGTFPQFGDTENESVLRSYNELIRNARKHGVDAATLDGLEWVATLGESGSVPAQSDRVFADGGYAVFRDRWLPAPHSAVVAHMTCNHFSRAHYHRDEGSFEIYGYGAELVVDAGKYSYDYGNPYVLHQRSVYAHNVVVIDDADYVGSQRPRLSASSISEQLSWAQCSTDGYRDRGITTQVRTFAHAKPNAFVFVDHIGSKKSHDYAQQVHLHPDMSDVRIEGRSVIARRRDGGPSLVVTALESPTATEIPRGLNHVRRLQGWYFPQWLKAEPTTVITFQYARAPKAVTLPVLIRVIPPGVEPTVPSGASYELAGRNVQIRWREDGADRKVELPQP